MEIKTISYGKTFNDGNYESSRIDMTASVDEGEDVLEAFEDLVDLVFDARKAEINFAKG